MLKGTPFYINKESSIFQDFPIYKVMKTSKGKVMCTHYDGSVSMVMQFDGKNNTDLTEHDFERMFRSIKQSFDDLNFSNTTLQFVMIRDNNVGRVNTEKLPSYLRPRAEFLTNLADDYKLFVNKFYMAVHVQAPKMDKNEGLITRYYNMWKYRHNEEVKLEKYFKDVSFRADECMNRMDSLYQLMTGLGGVTARVFQTEKEYYDMFQSFTRPNKSKKQKVKINNDSSNESPRQSLFSGVRATEKKNHFILDDYFHQIWTMQRTPRNTIFGKSIEAVAKVPYEFIYSVSFRTANHEESLRVFKTKLMERRMQTGSDQSSLVENLTLVAEEERVTKSYRAFAFGDGVGVVMSANFVLRIKESQLEKICRLSRTTRKQQILRFSDEIKKVFQKIGNAEWFCEDGTQWKVFNHMVPGCSSIFKDVMKTMFVTTNDVPYFIAMYDNNRKLVHNGTNHFIDERNNRMVFRLDDPDLPAWNYSISGQTGSGKSVLVNAILTMQFADTISGKPPVICILDVGGDQGSYTKFMTLVGGTQINLSRAIKPTIQMFELNAEVSFPTPDKIRSIVATLKEDILQSNPSMTEDRMYNLVREYYSKKYNDIDVENRENDYELRKLFLDIFEFPEKPFYRDIFKLRPGEVVPDEKTFNLIMGIIEVMLSSNTKVIDGFMRYDEADISEIVRQTYYSCKDRYPYMQDFYRKAAEMAGGDEKAAAQMLLKLKNFTREGNFPMFDADTSINMNNDVILADLKGLESSPQLQTIYTLLISKLYETKMYFTRDRRKMIIRDEAWSLMKNEKARKYFVEDLRTARKNGFITIAISQLPTDYLYPDAQDGKAIITSMQVNIFCKFSNDSTCQEVAREYGLNNELLEEMKKLGVQKVSMDDGSKKSLWSKFMMLTQGTDGGTKSAYILRNMLHPFEYALYSSSAEDNAVINYYLKVKKSYEKLEDVLWLIAENRHIGDEELAEYLTVSGYANMALRVRGLQVEEEEEV